jgi:hypothetical protein
MNEPKTAFEVLHTHNELALPHIKRLLDLYQGSNNFREQGALPRRKKKFFFLFNNTGYIRIRHLYRVVPSDFLGMIGVIILVSLLTDFWRPIYILLNIYISEILGGYIVVFFYDE